MKLINQRTAYSAIAGAAILVVLLPALWLNPTEYSAWAAGVQGCAVAVALSIGGATVASDRRERRLARALDLLYEYETGLVSEARGRLSTIVRREREGGGGPVSGVEIREGRLSVYGEAVVGGQLSTPSRDLAALLNYFARILRAVKTGAVDRSDLREMLGHHISWWNESLVNLQSYAAHPCLTILAELVE